MLFEATHTHPATMCPLKTTEGKASLKQLFSDQNIKKAGIKLNAAYFSCPKDAAVDHKGFFTIDADNAATVAKFFGTMAVDVRPIQTLKEVARML